MHRLDLTVVRCELPDSANAEQQAIVASTEECDPGVEKAGDVESVNVFGRAMQVREIEMCGQERGYVRLTRVGWSDLEGAHRHNLPIPGIASSHMSKVNIDTRDGVLVIEIDRPEVRNAVDLETSRLLHDAFDEFDADPDLAVAVLTGAGGNFCSGADLHALATEVGERAKPDGPGPMGPTRMRLSKPVIAAVEGYAVAGGLELALWCDLRVASESAIFGVFCRRFGVPLIDGGTVRLPRLVGQGRALDMILTGRGVAAGEAAAMGLADRVVSDGSALAAAIELAKEIGSHPQRCMRNDRASVYAQWGLDTAAAMSVEFDFGMSTIGSGETAKGAAAFGDGAGRHGSPRDG